MSREDVIRMAREAGMFWFDYGSNDGNANMLEKFAALVAAAERERCCKIVYGMAGSDNAAQRTVEKIREGQA